MSLAAPSQALAAGYAPSRADRQAICDRLATVVLADGTTLHPLMTAPRTPSAYDAWPKYAQSTYVGARLGVVGEHEFDVLVLLPDIDQESLIDAGDEVLAVTVEALWSLGRVTTAQPVQVAFDQRQSSPAIQIRVIPHPST